MAKRLGTVWLLLILTATVGHAQNKERVSAKEKVSAKEILDRMVSVYGSCKSYMDKGEVKEFRSNAAPIVRKPFTTAFVRPSLFRFEFTEDSHIRTRPHSFVVWRDGVSIRSWWSIKPETIYYETLKEPIARATGVSSMSAVIVPSMLFQNFGDRQVVQSLTELTLVREEKVSGRQAFRIQGTSVIKTPVTIWIDKETFLLLKFFQKRNFDNQDVELTIQYEPKINVEVPPEKLAFKH